MYIWTHIVQIPVVQSQLSLSLISRDFLPSSSKRSPLGFEEYLPRSLGGADFCLPPSHSDGYQSWASPKRALHTADHRV